MPTITLINGSQHSNLATSRAVYNIYDSIGIGEEGSWPEEIVAPGVRPCLSGLIIVELAECALEISDFFLGIKVE